MACLVFRYISSDGKAQLAADYWGIIGSGYLHNMIYSLAVTLNIQALEIS